MENKSTVSALQEFCAQAKTGNPVYEYIDGEEGGYVCKVILLDIESHGNGRSKRDAKHLAAGNILRKLRKMGILSNQGPATDDINDGASESLINELTNMNRDMLKELRDYCVRHDMPLPIIEIVQQSGTPNAPEFVACCSVASIKRYGKSDKKKDARQRAAIEMLCIISKETDLLGQNSQLVSTKPQVSILDLDCNFEDVESERRRKFKTYRELTDAGGDETQSIKLCDRHNYFKSYYPHLKEAALSELASDDYDTSKDKAMAVLSALKLTPKISTLEAKCMEPLLFIELNCDLDCVFMNLESKIYDQINKYFYNMLN